MFVKSIIYIIFLVLPLLGASKDYYYIDEEVLQEANEEYGASARMRLERLIALMNELQFKSEVKKVIAINKFFNDVPYGSDQSVWHRSDYWATTKEFLGKDRGDCEDYALSKYLALRGLGIESKKLYITYAKSLTYNVAHMVLSYFKRKNTVPYVLGNYIKNIKLATNRTDLIPVYSFNADKLFLAKQQGLGKIVPGGPSQLKKWSRFLYKIKHR